jgi:hypothetical protein
LSWAFARAAHPAIEVELMKQRAAPKLVRYRNSAQVGKSHA